MRVTNIEWSGLLNTSRVMLNNYHTIHDRFKTRGIDLCPYDVLIKEKNFKQFRVFLEDHWIIVETDSYKLKYTYKAGYTTDFASIPNIFRNIIDNDQDIVIRSALVHDVNFMGWLLDGTGGLILPTRSGFKATNTLFREMLKYDGLSRFKSNFAHFGVSTRIGWRQYKKNSEFDRYIISNFVEMGFL